MLRSGVKEVAIEVMGTGSYNPNVCSPARVCMRLPSTCCSCFARASLTLRLWVIARPLSAILAVVHVAFVPLSFSTVPCVSILCR